MNSIEHLESRIAPAALVIASLDHGKLTLTGDDNGDNFNLFQTGPNSFRLISTNATEFQLGAVGVPTNYLDFTGSVSSIDATFGAGSDNVTFNNLHLAGSLTIHDGEGANYPTLQNCVIGGNVSIFGGAASDTVFIAGNKTTIGGQLAVNSGDGGNTTTLTGHAMSLGSLRVLGGTGQNALIASAQLLTVKGGIDLDNTASSGSTSSFSSTIAAIGGTVAIHGGAGDDSFSMFGVRTSIKGNLTFDGGAGLAGISVLPTALSVGGNVAVTVGDNLTANPEYYQYTPAHQLKIGGDFSFQGGNGLHTFNATADLTDIGGHVSFTEGDHATGTNTFSLRGTDQLHVGKSLTVQQGGGTFATSVAGGTLLQVGGAVSITNGDHPAGTNTTVNFSSAITTKLAGAVTIHGGNGQHSIFLTGSENLSLGSLTVTGGMDKDTVLLTGAKTRVGGSANLDLGLGDADVTWNAFTRLDVAGDVHFSGSGASTGLKINAGAGLIKGSVSGDFGTSTQAILGLAGDAGLLQVAQGIKFLGVDTANSFISLARIIACGATDLSTGVGSDNVYIDDSVFTGTVKAALGDGADQLRIERLNTTHAASTTFLKGVQFDLGGGDNDRLVLGDALPNQRVTFAGPANFDGGAGLSDAYFTVPANVFKVTGQPVLAGFE